MLPGTQNLPGCQEGEVEGQVDRDQGVGDSEHQTWGLSLLRQATDRFW